MADDGSSLASYDSSVSCGSDGILLKLNGHDRFSQRNLQYFTRQQIHDYHSGAGGLTTNSSGGASNSAGFSNDSIAVYSFALKPEEHQPSGTCNFSRIDNAQLTGLDADLSLLLTTMFSVSVWVVRYSN